MSTPDDYTTNTDTTNTDTMTAERLVGVVKWFDKAKGYGFVQQLNTENDYFVHYSQLQSVDDHHTKYLVTGEYIEFDISEPVDTPARNDGKYSQIAVNVSGIQNGPLMFESQQPQRPYHRRDGFQYSRPRGSTRTPQPSTNPDNPDNPDTTDTPEVLHSNPFDVLETE